MFHMMNQIAHWGRHGRHHARLCRGTNIRCIMRAKSACRAAHASAQDFSTPQVPIIEHGDVRRMLMMQKAYVEGRAGAGVLLRDAGGSTSPRLSDEETQARGPAAAGSAHAGHQVLAGAMVPGGQQPGDPDARRLRLHA
jgi:hypothetical protein